MWLALYRTWARLLPLFKNLYKPLVNYFSLFWGLDLISGPLFLLKIFNG